MSEQITISLQYNSKYVSESAANMSKAITPRVSRFAKYLGIVFFVFFLIILYVYLVNQSVKLSHVVFLGMFSTFLCLAEQFPKWITLRSAKTSPNFGKELKFVFSPDQITVSIGSMSQTLTYRDIARYVKTQKGIILFTQRNLGYWLPLSNETKQSDLDQIIGWLQEQSHVPDLSDLAS